MGEFGRCLLFTFYFLTGSVEICRTSLNSDKNRQNFLRSTELGRDGRIRFRAVCRTASRFIKNFRGCSFFYNFTDSESGKNVRKISCKEIIMNKIIFLVLVIAFAAAANAQSKAERTLA